MLRIGVDGEIDLLLLEARHADELFSLIDENRDDLRRWLEWVDGTTEPEHVEAFLKSQLRRFADGGAYVFGILVGGRLAGALDLRLDDSPAHVGEFGYWLAQEFRGRGIMTRSVARLAEAAFEELGLKRLEIRCAAGNVASAAVARRLGFVHEGTLRSHHKLPDDRVDDELIFGILKGEVPGS